MGKDELIMKMIIFLIHIIIIFTFIIIFFSCNIMNIHVNDDSLYYHDLLK